MKKKIIALVVLMAFLFSIKPVVYAETHEHVHTDDCYEGPKMTKVNIIYVDSYWNGGMNYIRNMVCAESGAILATFYRHVDSVEPRTGEHVSLSNNAEATKNFIQYYDYNYINYQYVYNPDFYKISNFAPINQNIYNIDIPQWFVDDFGYKGCKAIGSGVPICDKVVTDITAPNKPYLVEYGTTAKTVATAHYLDGHTEEKEVLNTINTNQVGEQEIILSLSGVYVGTAKNPNQTISVPAKAIVYRVCPDSGARYITEECLSCYQNVETNTGISRIDEAASDLYDELEDKKIEVTNLQNQYLFE